MAQAKSVQIFGPSTLNLSDQGPEGSLIGLAKKALADARPDIDWTCEGTTLHISPGMAGRLRRALADKRPDVVVLRVPQNQFMGEYVVYRIRELWPGLYDRSLALSHWVVQLAGGGQLGDGSVNEGAFPSHWVVQLAGGGQAGAPTPRGWLFRIPRWVACRIIGTAPAVSVEAAVDLVKQTIDAVLRFEDVHLVYLMSTPTVQPNILAAAAAKKREHFVRGVGGYCDQHQVPWLDPMTAYGASGRTRAAAVDGWHSTSDDREFDGWILAQSILQTLDGSRTIEVGQPPAG